MSLKFSKGDWKQVWWCPWGWKERRTEPKNGGEDGEEFRSNGGSPELYQGRF